MLNDFLRKAAIKYSGKSSFEVPAEEQKGYIYKFREPRSYIERSFFQYKAQMRFKGFCGTFLINLASIPLFFIYFLKPSKRIKQKLNADAVFVKDNGVTNNILPKSLFLEFDKLELNASEGNKLKIKDRLYVVKLLLRYPLSWHFALKSIIKIMKYRWLIELYRPKALIVHNEYSFTSSMLTDFCNKNGVELINVMHGEKLFNITDSFFKFNRCYIWDEFYRKLFCELRAAPDQFIVAIPPSMVFEKDDVPVNVDYTYYLQAQTGNALTSVIKLLVELRNKGFKVAIRPHPRFTNLNELREALINSDIEVEDCDNMNVKKSILRTKNVVSVYSTVLQQAYYNKIGIVIDDVSNPERIRKLIEHQYIMLNVEHALLSDIMRAAEVNV